MYLQCPFSGRHIICDRPFLTVVSQSYATIREYGKKGVKYERGQYASSVEDRAVQQRIGIDVGGTNTDAVLMQGRGGRWLGQNTHHG